jgi:hypothetical protein
MLARLYLVLLLSFRYQDDNLSLTSSSRSSKALDHADWRGQAVVRYDQVDVSNIKSLLSHAGCDESVELSAFELPYRFRLYFLRHFLLLSKESIGPYKSLLANCLFKIALDLLRRLSVLHKDDHLRLFSMVWILEECFQQLCQLSELGMFSST